MEKLRPRAREPMERHIIKLLDRTRDVVPLLVFVRGDSYKARGTPCMPPTLQIKHYIIRK